MKERLNGYIQGLFSDAERRSPDNTRLAELKEELILNTCEKYDDLVAMGKPPEAAYRAAVDGIGDISQLLREIVGEGTEKKEATLDYGEAPISAPVPVEPSQEMSDEQAADDDEDDEDNEDEDDEKHPPRSRWYGLVSGIIWTVILCAYFSLSFSTHAWSVTWLLFLMGIAADNVAKCIFDLRR